ncbi:hypothetical protein [Acidovorax sp. 100]|uniref:hypothetical protein n=1 Tax=Acidovorax sp. 100 TaxID=2135635 RepID=UPI0011C4289B|nr:hypothetical protein [Acidovorax sp. 100]
MAIRQAANAAQGSFEVLGHLVHGLCDLTGRGVEGGGIPLASSMNSFSLLEHPVSISTCMYMGHGTQNVTHPLQRKRPLLLFK